MRFSNYIKMPNQKHMKACDFFESQAKLGEVGYQPKFDGIQLVSPAQGIYKPADQEYVLSVKETLKAIYPDKKPIILPDGSKLYPYHQQGDSTANSRDTISANIALQKNIQDKVPLGVWTQTQAKCKEGTRYIIELGVPISWCKGYFFILIPSLQGEIWDAILTMSPNELYTYILKENQAIQTELAQKDDIIPENDEQAEVDARKRQLRYIVQRQGQSSFRKKIIDAYDGKCAFTRYSMVEVLEAAHITPYMGQHTNTVNNGILLRADMHTLWDLGMIAINPETMCIEIHSKLLKTEYANLNGKKVYLPHDIEKHPSKAALEKQYELFRG